MEVAELRLIGGINLVIPYQFQVFQVAFRLCERDHLKLRSPKVPLALSLLGHAGVTLVWRLGGIGSVYGLNKWVYPLSVPGFSSRPSLLREGPS